MRIERNDMAVSWDQVSGLFPTYQRKGVGRAIVEDIQNRLQGFLVVTLTAAPDVQPFYRRLGWRNQTTAIIRPRAKDQELLNCPVGTD